MLIKNIKDPKIQQMAVVEAIKQLPEWFTLEQILNREIDFALIPSSTLQGSFFWKEVFDGNTPLYTDKGLWYKATKVEHSKRFINSKLYQCVKDTIELTDVFINEQGNSDGYYPFNAQVFILATPEEVYNHLKQKDMSNPTYGKNTIYSQEVGIKQPETTQTSGSSINEINIPTECRDNYISNSLQNLQEGESTSRLLNGALDKIIILEKEKKDLTSKLDNINDMMSFSNKGYQSKIKELEAQNEKLNKLVDEIASKCEDQTNPRMKLYAIRLLICSCHNPSLVGTTQMVEIDGKKYEVEVKKEI